jgi:hypothetical protein
MKSIAFFGMLLGLLPLIAQGQSLTAFFDEADALFGQYVAEGRIDYQDLAQSGDLAPLLRQIEGASLRGQSAAVQQAFYINAYNLLVLQAVIERLPLASVLKVEGFFDRIEHPVAGESLTLDQIEKEKLLGAYGDPRFHFVVVCGAVDCPPLTTFAYRPAQLEAQLTQQTRRAVNDPQFIRVDTRRQQVQLSQIFEWYASDFGGSRASAVQFINRYRRQPIPRGYAIGFYPYDWSLNAL